MANLTLTIDDDLLKGARRLAFERETSVNAMVRNFLADQVRNEQENADRIAEMEFFFGKAVLGDKGITWTREELYDLGR